MLKVFITDLSAYNKGHLHGEWISLPCDDLEEIVSKILTSGENLCALNYGYEKHEEYFITDWEWEEISLWDISEYENIFELNSTIEKLESLSVIELKAIKFLIEQSIVSNIDEALDKYEDVVIYENTSLKEYSYTLIEELYDLKSIPSIISNNIDYESIAIDLSYEGIYYEMDDDLIEYIN
ncbi:hypothetical protein CRV03_01495 [Arcobacter sp. F155]|uniref:antirestriction protein ArdA n=1 Tax=Arcobacter sp. F155 TaxID=2044512 RepID=UPI00100BAF50|nr:antirestriction protein ArdA [Arcobacter sp. F155]RXJ78730.1 hypothetical protein CRV03_01495 [Arcobacter sp. F155]